MASISKLRHAVSASSADAAALPLDALFEVLLRLPAKDVCRLRVVCRSWRALTCDPHFATAHKSRHAEPLLAFTYGDGDGDDRGVAIVGLSGQVLRRIAVGSDGIELQLTHFGRLCVIRMCNTSLPASVLNPASASALTFSGPYSHEFAGARIDQTFDWESALTFNCTAYAFGQVASTGDYKVLRVSHPDARQPQVCEIVTLDRSSQGIMWRRKQNPPSDLMRNHVIECLAVDGVVYFFLDCRLMEPTSIAPFDLDTEKWMPTLRGPEPLRNAKFGLDTGRELSFANLNGSLVIVDNDVGVSFDLWFLVDHKTGLWVKKYRLNTKQLCYLVQPLLILDDGRIVIFEAAQKLLQCYDPTTGNLADVFAIRAMGLAESQSVGVYKGSLLI